MVPNTSSWSKFYKRSPDPGYHHVRCETNLMYTPLVNKEQTVMCMHWDSSSEYQRPNERPLFTQELLDYFFKKEVFFINKFRDFEYTPEVYEIDYDQRKVFIEWAGETCNDIIYDSSRSIDKECPTWKQQLLQIVESVYNTGVYKISLYPHCFFIKDGVLKTFDWYGCFDVRDCLVEYKILAGMTGSHSSVRFDNATEGRHVDFSVFYKQALQKYIKWPGDPLPELHARLFKEGA